MKVKTITYARIKNLGNYENERAECVIELNDGDEYDVAFKAAEQIICNQLNVPISSTKFEDKYHKILANKNDYSFKEVTEAEAYFENKKVILN